MRKITKYVILVLYMFPSQGIACRHVNYSLGVVNIKCTVANKMEENGKFSIASVVLISCPLVLCFNTETESVANTDHCGWQWRGKRDLPRAVYPTSQITISDSSNQPFSGTASDQLFQRTITTLQWSGGMQYIYNNFKRSLPEFYKDI